MAPSVKLNTTQFNIRLQKLLDAWDVSKVAFIENFPCLTQRCQNASKNEEYEAIADCDGLLLTNGDPASSDEPIRKSVALQVRLP